MKPIYKLLLVALIAVWTPQPSFALFPHIHLPHLHLPIPHLHRAKKAPAPAQKQNAGESTEQNAPAAEQNSSATTQSESASGQSAPASGQNASATSQSESASGQNAPASEESASAPEENSGGEAPVSLVGPTAFGQIVGKHTNMGNIYTAGVGVGYNITNHFGGDVGFTIYTVQSPYPIVTNKDWRWTTLVGDPFIDFRYSTKVSGMDFVSILTGTAPLSSPERVYTTGRFGVDWFNHLEAHYMGFTPFVNFGAANESVDRYILPRPFDIARPYQTYGFRGNFEGGGSFALFKNYKIGASAYAVVPGGTQKIFSRLVAPDSTVSGDADNYRYWNNAFEKIGDSSFGRDNGYSGWFDVTRFQNLTIEVGYTYSVHYKLGSAYLMLRYDGTSLMRFLTATE